MKSFILISQIYYTWVQRPGEALKLLSLSPQANPSATLSQLMPQMGTGTLAFLLSLGP